MKGMKPFTQVRILLEVIDMPWNQEKRDVAYKYTLEPHHCPEKGRNWLWRVYTVPQENCRWCRHEQPRQRVSWHLILDSTSTMQTPDWAKLEKTRNQRVFPCTLDPHALWVLSAEPQLLMLHMREEVEESGANWGVSAISVKRKKTIKCFNCGRTGCIWRKCQDKKQGKSPKNKDWHQPHGKAKK